MANSKSLRTLYESSGFRLGAARVRQDEAQLLHRAGDHIHAAHNDRIGHSILHSHIAEVVRYFDSWNERWLKGVAR